MHMYMYVTLIHSLRMRAISNVNAMDNFAHAQTLGQCLWPIYMGTIVIGYAGTMVHLEYRRYLAAGT